ncbi:iron-containing alcohol dehydrogenase [Labrys neptuniae]|uniref:iron-containing alcohol dehydrogenase n=1 Tax=Labrys neptuniae TaxID=376174 RepID=UPI00289237B1|nr:iron-containing alcohol dehydrogenase [Labrys neptuniae]MDT3375702.1 iron-containing alcohol dehydrogenase [Labrys neptuniae]
MSRYQLSHLPRITGGPGARELAGELTAARLGKGAQVLLVVDPGLKATGLIDDVEASLRKAGLGVSVFSEFGGDPTIASADAAAAQARRTKAKAVVSLGGGSALDLGKVVAAVATTAATARRSAEAYELCKRPFPRKRLVSLVIPTTSGTGSECTRTAILTRSDKAKVWLWGEELKPDEVILDPETTLSLPPVLTAWTGIDTLVHALEATTNGNATPANNVYAHEAIRLAVGNLPDAVGKGSDLAAREGLQRAAALAGIAIDNCGTAVAHNIGHALGSLRPVQHGRSVALGMIATLDWNIEDDDGRFTAAARAMGLTSSADLPAAFEKLVRAIGIKVSLADEFAGITATRLAEQMARPENAAMRTSNRRTIEEADLLRFAERVLTQA